MQDRAMVWYGPVAAEERANEISKVIDWHNVPGARHRYTWWYGWAMRTP